MNEREGTQEEKVLEEKTGGKKDSGSRRNRKSSKKAMIGVAVVLLLLAGVVGFAVYYVNQPKGYQEYTVQLEQYYVEYSDEYDYWDVLTVEYPRLEGIDEAVQETLNQLMYDTAMDRVNYWHFFPNEDVKEFQEEHYSIFCSDVICDVTFHSQYLLSMDFFELYSAGNPVWMTNSAERALTVDLLTGESYALEDIVEINRDFIKEWDKAYSREEGVGTSDDESLDLLLDCFLQQDEEMMEYYLCRPFFYVLEDGDFVVGISMDPVLERVVTYEPTYRNIYTYMEEEELEPYKKESEFWNKYEKSETAGEVLPCQDKAENIWLGENAGIWQ